MSHGIKNRSFKFDSAHSQLGANQGTIESLRFMRTSTDNILTSNLNTLNNDHESHVRRYNEGSVYRQASRFNPYVSSSTNISSSVSGSVELIISDLEENIDSQPRQNLSPLREDSNEGSDDPETALIQNIINQKRSMSYDKRNIEFSNLNQTMVKLQQMKKRKESEKERHLHLLRLQILQAINIKNR